METYDVIKNIPLISEPKESIQLLSDQEILNKLKDAQNLARMGLYAESDIILDDIAEAKGDKSITLDLRAKILAQQGRFAEAERCWMEALSLDPGNQAFRRSLDYLVGSRSRSFIPILKYTSLILVAFGLIVLVTMNRPPAIEEGEIDAALSKLASIEQNIGMIQDDIRISESSLEKKYQQIYDLQEQQYLKNENLLIKEIEFLKSRLYEAQEPSRSHEAD